MSYQESRWVRKNEIAAVCNPSPGYVTLYDLHADGKVIDDGVVTPFSHRQQSWYKSQGVCEIAQQTLDTYNNVLPILKVKLNPSQLDVTGFVSS